MGEQPTRRTQAWVPMPFVFFVYERRQTRRTNGKTRRHIPKTPAFFRRSVLNGPYRCVIPSVAEGSCYKMSAEIKKFAKRTIKSPKEKPATGRVFGIRDMRKKVAGMDIATIRRPELLAQLVQRRRAAPISIRRGPIRRRSYDVLGHSNAHR